MNFFLSIVRVVSQEIPHRFFFFVSSVEENKKNDRKKMGFAKEYGVETLLALGGVFFFCIGRFIASRPVDSTAVSVDGTYTSDQMCNTGGVCRQVIRYRLPGESIDRTFTRQNRSQLRMVRAGTKIQLLYNPADEFPESTVREYVNERVLGNIFTAFSVTMFIPLGFRLYKRMATDR
jgi:hypothetical protein